MTHVSACCRQDEEELSVEGKHAAVFIAGPTGVGKTAHVYAAAQVVCLGLLLMFCCVICLHDVKHVMRLNLTCYASCMQSNNVMHGA